MREHNVGKEWTFEWSRSKKNFGAAVEKTVRGNPVKALVLSKYMTPLLSEESVKDTILHEIAHIIVGLDHGHDKEWQKKAISIGAKVKDFNAAEIRAAQILSPYHYRCSQDGDTLFWNNKPMSTVDLLCPEHFVPVNRYYHGILDNPTVRIL